MIINLEGLAKKISSEEIAILAICRNVENNLESELLKLIDAFSDFTRLHIRIVESDSSDNTVNLLKQLSETLLNFEYRSLGNLELSIENRWERIAYCRNTYLQMLREDQDLSKVTYFAVADLDGVNTLIDRSAVLSCWLRDDWDVCTANQNAPYYDVFALRHSIWSPDDCWKFENSLRRQGVHPTLATEIAVYKRQRWISKFSEWIEVDSAFGGLAIYRRSILRDAQYRGILNDGSIVCEHVPFHESLRSYGARIFINPRMINASWNAHTAPHRRLNRLKRAIKLFFVRLKLEKLLGKN